MRAPSSILTEVDTGHLCYPERKAYTVSTFSQRVYKAHLDIWHLSIWHLITAIALAEYDSQDSQYTSIFQLTFLYLQKFR